MKSKRGSQVPSFFSQARKKGFLEMPFAWTFAIIIGMVILFLAIYASTRIIDTEKTELDATTAKEIGILLNPLETGFETGKTSVIELPSETRISNRCNNNGNFGRQIIRVSQKSFNEWSDSGIDVGFSNKYIFSEQNVEGKKFFVFSKPFEFPYKTADMIYLTSSKNSYCFVGAPENIEEEISNLNQENLNVGNCSSNSLQVCFQSGNCNITVNYEQGIVSKGSVSDFYFVDDASMYAAIFSDGEVYDCQLKRVMQRGAQLSSIYEQKTNFISREGCTSTMSPGLLELKSYQENFDSSQDLQGIMEINAENLDSQNDIVECKLW